MSNNTPTAVEWLQAQVTNQKYRLKIQRQKNQKLKEIVECSEKCTTIMSRLIKEGKISKAIDLIVEMNQCLQKECEAMEKCDEITNEHCDTLGATMQILTSKPNQVGQAKNPEMQNFQMKMSNHSQMFITQNVKHFNAYCDNFNDNKPKNNN